ncbi:hypothetical protein Taro_047443 [Colocasia esculenta]|uniref:Pentatricopeptide repeat-containing protein n=1 Tax=Colocasia esculenta TaxID=4460 RepID=A0A843X5F7_COLES|nr:hypothetical protein [Colocasia esculenta]
MSRRGAAMAVSQSLAFLASLKSKQPSGARLLPDPSVRSPLCFLSSSRSASCSPPDDDLGGLVDPDFASPLEGGLPSGKKHCEGRLSAKDFAFLCEAVADRDTSSRGPSADVGSSSADAVAISEMIRSTGDMFDEKTQRSLRQFRGKLEESLVNEVLRLVKEPDLGVKFFIWTGRQIGYRHNNATYDVLLEILGFDKRHRIPEHFLREVGEDDSEVLGKLLNVLVHKCCRNGFWNEALEELGRLKDFGYKATRTTYNALMQVLLKAGRLDSATLVHREMSNSGFCMDRLTIGYFARALCKEGRWVDALNVIEEEDFTPDTVLYTKMIDGLMEASLFEEAMSFLHRMRSRSCIPNAVTYRTLLSGFLRKKQLGWCKRIINMAITEGCNPSPSLFNSLVHAYCHSGDYCYAYKLLKKMAGCGCQPGYITYNIFIGAICANDHVPGSDTLEVAEKVYMEMLDAGFVLNKVNVGNYARCLCATGKFEKAFSVFKEMMRKGFVPDASTYGKVIDFLCQAYKVEKAFLLFEEMKKSGVLPDVYTYTTLIDSFCKVGLIQQARKWFDEMIRYGCVPNVVTHTALIHAYLKAVRLMEANELFENMVSAGCLPNVVTYTALIDGLCKAGEIEKACQVYARMRGTGETKVKDIYFEGVGAHNPEPNVFTYGALVDGLCKAHKVAEARDLLDAMKLTGCDPNHVVYDALIDGFCKVGKLDEAQEVFGKMTEHGYTPNVYTYSSLIDRYFKDRRVDLALKVLSRMLEDSCTPNVITYTEMIDGLCKVGKTDDAFKLISLMEEKGCNPNVVTYTAMIDGFGKAGNVDRCIYLLNQMTAKGCAPNFVTYRVLINHCCTSGLLDEAHRLLEEMKQTYWPRFVSGYKNVIQGFSREFLALHGLLEEIPGDGSMPIAPAYCLLIESFTKAGRLEVALELYKELMSSSSICSEFRNRNLYSSLIEGLCRASKVDKALDLYVEVTRCGAIPELDLFFCIMKGLFKINKWEEALQISYCVCHMIVVAKSGHLGP